MHYDVLIAGGGAAGFFAAINIAENNPKLTIAILERGKEVLTKVKVSGGGRCNVTHAEFDPVALTKNYPRGEKELRGPFHTFCSGDTVDFFEKRGVQLKIEDDGRMFPVTNSSQTIIDCFLSEAKKHKIKVLTEHAVQQIRALTGAEVPSLGHGNPVWEIQTNNGTFTCDKLLMATGSNPKIWQLLEGLGHTVVPPVPSLFTFNIKDERIAGLMGLSCMAKVKLLNRDNSPLRGETSAKADRGGCFGDVLITHWGLSGPAILKLSAWGARELHTVGYKFNLEVNWLYPLTFEEALEQLSTTKDAEAKKLVVNTKPFDLPKRLWLSLVNASTITDAQRWADVSKKQLQELAAQLTQCTFGVNGKSTFKEEFVTAGGVSLKEINFKTFESKLLPNLYLAGEVLNIDAITGGFNFQNAWTGAFIAAKGIAG